MLYIRVDRTRFPPLVFFHMTIGRTVWQFLDFFHLYMLKWKNVEN